MDEEQTTNIAPKEPVKKKKWIWYIVIGLILIALIIVIVMSKIISLKQFSIGLLIVFILALIGLMVYFGIKYLKEKNKPIVTEKPCITKNEAKELEKKFMKEDHFVLIDLKNGGVEIDAVKNIGKENHPKVKIHHLRTKDINTADYWDIIIRLDNPEDHTELKNAKEEKVNEALNQLADFKPQGETIVREERDSISGEVVRTITSPTPNLEEKVNKEDEEAVI